MTLLALIIALAAALAHGATDVRVIASDTSPDVGIEFFAPACPSQAAPGFVVIDGDIMTVACGDSYQDIRLTP